MERLRRAPGASPRFAWSALSQALVLLEISWHVAYGADREVLGVAKCCRVLEGLAVGQMVALGRPRPINRAESHGRMPSDRMRSPRRGTARWAPFRKLRPLPDPAKMA